MAPSGRYRQRFAKGFNLVEVLIATSVLALLFGFAMPGIIGSIHRYGVDGASRRLAEDVRLTQSTALTRGIQARLIVFNQAGVALNPGSTNITDTTKANRYRIEVRSGPSALWPALADSPATNANVITAWQDLGRDYRSVEITSGNTLIFNSQGFLGNSASALSVVLVGSGGTRTVQTSVIGKAQIL
jgi:prepilin-type N-terminal cleavage/methylation domain-containing protein